jgi:nucleoside-diphosphate-sugar epimerase
VIDFVITGTRGFIGGTLSRDLKAQGYSVMDEAAFREGADNCRIFVNCVNNPGNPAANVKLTDDKMELARFRCEKFVQFMSFITLVGKGQLNPQAFNFGFSPALFDFYVAGKLEQEKHIAATYKKLSAKTVILAYMPIVLGEGGGWDNVLSDAARNGVVLPDGISPAARANFIDVTQVRDYMVSLLSQDSRRDFDRVILNDPASAQTTWQDFFAAAGSPAVAPKASLKSWVRGAVERKAIGTLYHFGYVLRASKFLGKVKKPPPYTPRGPAGESPSVVTFGGTMLPVIQTQPYLAN